MEQRVFIFLLIIWAKVEASNTTTGSNWTVVLKVFENCLDKENSLTCLQQKVLNFATRMTQTKSLEIIDGFKFVRDEQTARSLNDPESKTLGATLTDQIWNKLSSFFKTHSVEVNIPKFLDTDNEARKKKGHGGIFLLAGAIKGAMLYMGLHAVAALAGKALIVAKIALTIASVIALKKLLEGGEEKTSYEIIKHPQHSYVQTHSSSHEYGGGGGGGGGHGGGYEGHYRKRSITRSRMNVHPEFAPPKDINDAPDSWRFQLPKDSKYPKQEIILNVDPKESEEFLLFKQTADESQGESVKRNLFDTDLRGNHGQSELNEDRLISNEKFTPLRLRRSVLTKFVVTA